MGIHATAPHLNLPCPASGCRDPGDVISLHACEAVQLRFVVWLVIGRFREPGSARFCSSVAQN